MTMAKMTPCPACGEPVDLHDDAIFLTGCPHCRTVLPRGADGWELLRLHRLIRDLFDALFAEVREKYRRTVMDDDEVWEYLASEHGIARVPGLTPYNPERA